MSLIPAGPATPIGAIRSCWGCFTRSQRAGTATPGGGLRHTGRHLGLTCGRCPILVPLVVCHSMFHCQLWCHIDSICADYVLQEKPCTRRCMFIYDRQLEQDSMRGLFCPVLSPPIPHMTKHLPLLLHCHELCHILCKCCNLNTLLLTSLYPGKPLVLANGTVLPLDYMQQIHMRCPQPPYAACKPRNASVDTNDTTSYFTLYAHTHDSYASQTCKHVRICNTCIGGACPPSVASSKPEKPLVVAAVVPMPPSEALS